MTAKRLALVTGGSSGLGMALCTAFIARGFRVIEFSRSTPHPFSVHADMASPGSYKYFARALAALTNEGPWDEIVAVSNAGTLHPMGPASRQTPADTVSGLNTNLTSAVLFIAQVVESFQAAPCRKVVANISSGAAVNARAGWSLYGAAKAGMEHFIRSLAVEQSMQAHPLLAVNIDPGVMDTAMQAAIRASSPADFPEVDRFIRRRDDGELRAPSAVAEAVLRIVALPSLTPGGRYLAAEHLASG